MTQEEAISLLRTYGIEWIVDSVKTEKSYHFIKCFYTTTKGRKLRGTVVYNDMMDKIMSLTLEDVYGGKKG